ncbi:MAG: IS1380 family transposase, partial [Candidatus Dormibacteraceae bacterium]
MRDSQLTLDLPAVSGKEVAVRFDGGDLTSDAGLVLLREADRRLGITEALVSCIEDCRQQAKVEHPVEEMVRARVYGIAQGYSDCNDMNTLRHDAAFKVSCETLPSESPLASQSTLSRFENAMTARDLKRARVDLARAVLRQVPANTKVMILEVDATDDPCHGQQQLELFNGYYREHCYVPLLFHVVEPGSRRHLLWSLLRPGNASSGKGLPGTMREILRLIRERLGTKVRILVRADSGFGNGKILELLNSEQVDFVLGLPSNAALTKLAVQAHLRAAVGYKFHGEGYRVFETFEYAAKPWSKKHRVVVKVEMTQHAFNPRYVVTSLPGGSAE